MTPAEVRRYLATHRRVGLADLCHRFEVEADAMRAMLSIWAAKGRVRRVERAAGCRLGSCSACHEGPAEVYEWVERRSV